MLSVGLAAKRPLILLSLVLVTIALCLGCSSEPTPTAAPFPTALPTATPGVIESLDGALFTISIDDQILATEELAADLTDDQMVLFSEIRWLTGEPRIERRTVLVSTSLNPLRYDLEQTVLGVRSVWTAERRTAALDILNNNQQWAGPTRYEGVSPAPSVMIEGLPSALPYALLGLRYTQSPEEMTELRVVDVTEDRPLSRPLAVRLNPDRTGAVIGTVALEVEIDDGLNPQSTIWLRQTSRALYGVEMSEPRLGYWGERLAEGIPLSGTLRIQRVSKLPDAPAPSAIIEGAVPLDWTSADGVQIAGEMYLPSGDGSFPCLVVHSLDGFQTRWRDAARFTQEGWAVYVYDKRGLGESEGEYARGDLLAMAEDARAAAFMLSQRDEIDASRIVFLGLNEGAQVGALALAGDSAYAGAALGAALTDLPLFPDLIDSRIERVLAPAYGWNPQQIDDYREHSVIQWRDWLYAGEPSVALVGRRVSLKGLRSYGDLDLAGAVQSVSVPVLVLHGEGDQWTPVEGTRSLAERAGGDFELITFPDLGADLTGADGDPLAPEVKEALFQWLGQF